MQKLWLLIVLLLLQGCVTRTIYVDTPKVMPNESWLQTCTIERPADNWYQLTDSERIEVLTIQLIKQIKHTHLCNTRLSNIKTWKIENQ